MSIKRFTDAATIAVFIGLAGSTTLASITIPTVTIGNPGNAADPTTGFGSVPYTYNIGTTEVTNAQYATFLNAVAATDTNGLYNPSMAGSFGGITRSGSAGSYTYSTVSGRANNPVNYISFWDALRFANWLHNGQPTGAQSDGTTENGAYTLTSAGISANTITRNAGWNWSVPTEDEWYKAAYHQPASAGGDADNYWLWPTSSNEAPTTAQANYRNIAVGTAMPVGGYAPNFYGAFDMGGNVFEWNDAIINGSFRSVRGGSFDTIINTLRADSRSTTNPRVESASIGFRVSQIPAPGSVALLAIGGLVTARRRR